MPCGRSPPYCAHIRGNLGVYSVPLNSAKSAAAATEKQEERSPEDNKVPGIFSLDPKFGKPTLVPQREFPESRHKLPDTPEVLKHDFRLLAQEAVILLTRDSSNPLKGVDDWLDRLKSEGFRVEGISMEQLIVSSRDHLRKMRLYELMIGRDDQAERCGALASRFEVLHNRFLKPAENAAPTQNPEVATAHAAARRKVVMPILESKGWSRGKWVTKAGVGKNCVYEYLDGKRSLTLENRKAMAEALGLKPDQLPD